MIFLIHRTIISNELKVTILPLDFSMDVFTQQIKEKLCVLQGLGSTSQIFFSCLFSICAGCFDALNPEKLPSTPTCCEPCELRASCNLPSNMKEITLFHAMIPHEI